MRDSMALTKRGPARRRWPRACSIALALVLLLTLGAIAATSASGSPFVAQSPPAQAIQVSDVHAAMNARGDFVAVWVQQTDPGGPLRIAAGARPAGQSFAAVQTISDVTFPQSSGPRVGIDAQGNATAIWGSKAPGVTTVSVAKAPYKQQFGAPQVLDTAGNPNNPDIAVAPTGEAIAAWMFENNGQGVRASVAAAGQSFPASQQTLYPGGVYTAYGPPAAAYGAGGHGAVLWTESDDMNRRVEIATVGPGGTSLQTDPAPYLSAPVAGPLLPADVAVDGQGRTVAAWTDSQNGSTGAFAEVRAASGGGFDHPAHQLGTPAATSPRVASDSAGNMVAVWDGGDNHIYGAFRPAAAATNDGFGSPQTLDGGSGGVADPTVASDPAGNAVAAWADSSGIHGVLGPTTGPFGSELVVASGSSIRPDATMGGDGAVVYQGTQQGSGVAGVAAIDNEPPVLGNLSIPTTGTAGQPITFSVDTFDVWGPASVEWLFGGGGEGAAIGSTVQHTYLSPGDYDVWGFAADPAGNYVLIPHTNVHVKPAPLPPPEEGTTYNVERAVGTVLVSTPKAGGAAKGAGRIVANSAAAVTPPKGYTAFRRLRNPRHIPIGSIIDATKGRVKVTMASNNRGGAMTGQFSEGAFRTSQGKKNALTTLTLLSNDDFRRGCRSNVGLIPKDVGAARRRPRRRVFGNARGRFRTRGRHSTATVRGTKWLTQDTCAGTLTVVRSGSVLVRDLVKNRSRIVRAGHRYLARPKK